jgi:HEAT repeat protein
MSCEENRYRISLLIDGELEEAAAAALRRHIDGCAECARYLTELRAGIKALELAPRVSVSPSFHRRLESRLRRGDSGAYSPPIMVRMWARRAVAAAIAAGVLIAIVLILSSLGMENGETSLPAGGKDKIADGEKKKIEVPPAPAPTEKIVVPKHEEPEKAPPEIPEEMKLVDKPEPGVPVDKHIPPEPEREQDKAVVKEQHREPGSSEEPKKPDVPRKHPGTYTVDNGPGEKPIRDQHQEAKLADKELKDLDKRLAKAFKNGDTDAQIGIVQHLAKMPAEKACKILKGVLAAKKVKTAVRREAVFALAEVGTKQAAGILLYTYGDENWEVSDTVPQALSEIKQRKTLEWLAGEVLVSSKSAAVRKMLAEALAHVEQPVSQKYFAAALAKEKEAAVRAAICEALGAAGNIEAEDTLIKMLDDKSWLVREAALRALASAGTMKCTLRVIRALNDPKPEVKEAAAAALAENPDVRAVVPLVRLLMFKDLRLHGAVLTALWRITGKRYMKESQWHAWLKEVGPYPETDPNPDATPPAPASFLDIPLWSKSVIFLVDSSSSMQRDGKIKEAKQLIQKSIVQLPEETRFNVIFFGSSVRGFSQTKFPKASVHTKQKALNWLDRVRLPKTGRTNFYLALVTVLRNKPDDVIVISDGVPTEGRYVHPPKVVREITSQNLQQKTRIHCLGFYTLQPTEGRTPVPVGPGVDFLRSLATRNQGEFKYRWFNADTGGR